MNEVEFKKGECHALREVAEMLGTTMPTYANIRKRIGDLLAVVERLPRTADGVPAVPGMTVWLNPRVEVKAWHDRYGIVFEFPSGVRPQDYDPNTDTLEPFYSTREAAEAARGSE